MRLVRNNRGQLLVISALLMAVLSLSLALSIYRTGLYRQQLRYEPVKETVLGITNDLDRALAQALRRASLTYYETGSEEAASLEGNNFISRWIRSAVSASVYLGSRISVSPAEDGLTDAWFLFSWGRGGGLSYGYCKFALDIDAYGFKGWAGYHEKFVRLNILEDSLNVTEPTDTKKLDIMIVMDRSGSTDQESEPGDPKSKMDYAKDATKAFVDQLDMSRIRVGLVSYATTATLNASLTNSSETVKSAIDALYVRRDVLVPPKNKPDIYSNIGGAIDRSCDEFEENGRPDAEWIMILLSEGIANIDSMGQYSPARGREYALVQAERAESLGVGIDSYTIGVGDKYRQGTEKVYHKWSSFDEDLLKDIQTAGYYYAPSVKDLMDIYLRIAEKLVGYTTMSFNVVSDAGPVPNLTPDSLEIHVSAIGGISVTARILDLEYLGGGSYIVRFSPRINPYTLGLVVYVSNPEDQTRVCATYQSPELVHVNLSSEEEAGGSANLGQIQLGNSVFSLPNSTDIPPGTYYLQYTPEPGYTFLNWTTGSATEQPHEATVSINIAGDKNITVLYQAGNETEPAPQTVDLPLNSKDWTGLSHNLGQIRLNETTYDLPESGIDLNTGRYEIEYVPQNESYRFLWWDVIGGVVAWNSTSSSTTIWINGDGKVSAIYAFRPSTTQRHLGGDWATLFVDSGAQLLPSHLWSGDNGRLYPSQGEGNAQTVVLNSLPTPEIRLARYVNVTAFIRPISASGAKDITMELGFTHDGQFYKIGSGVYSVNKQGIYLLTVDSSLGEYPMDIGLIPQGSVITLNVTLTFHGPGGTFLLYYGNDKPSCVKLFNAPFV